MPLYEYHCQKCENRFELLRRLSDSDNDVVCPRCHSPEVEREISPLAGVGSSTRSGSAGTPDASCGSGRFG